MLQLAKHVELATGGAHRVDPQRLVGVLRRLGYSVMLQNSTATLHKFKHGVRHQYLTVCLPGACRVGEGDGRVACRHTAAICRSAASTNRQHSLTYCRCFLFTHADAASPAGMKTVIVETAWRDSFSVAHPTPRYAAILAACPSTIVADRVSWAGAGAGRAVWAIQRLWLAQASTACVCCLRLLTLTPHPPLQSSVALQSRLHSAASLLAREMARSFADVSLELPPWRTAQALLNRWHLGAGVAPPPPAAPQPPKSADLVAKQRPAHAFGGA